MKIEMDDSRFTNINQIRAFLKGSEKLDLKLEDSSIDERYKFVRDTIGRLNYDHLRKRDRSVVVNYLRKLSGYKKPYLHRLISKACQGELIREEYNRENPNHKYLPYDIKLLEKTDEHHARLNGLATQEILRREYEVFGNKEYGNISQISASHIYNLRNTKIYKSKYLKRTQASQTAIGKTQPPRSLGRPGSIRVDTVHQRDVYHINSVDEVTQWEIVVCVPELTREFVRPALSEILDQYPFKVFNFHSDRGHEFINYDVAGWLEEQLIKQTKNRSYHCNDNAQVETKNGSVIRKNMGWDHINRDLVNLINYYFKNYFNIYLNYHRPSIYPTRVIHYGNGRRRKKYEQAMIPYDKLKEVSEIKKQNFLKPGLTFEKLDKIAFEYSDNQFAEIKRREETKLFEAIDRLNLEGGARSEVP